ncbi:MAG TPA: hypothetical protein VJK54_04930 [Chthoniobacterales bacterium]|nr:hypothetical protein [Chthoniobacterales bacterium]
MLTSSQEKFDGTPVKQQVMPLYCNAFLLKAMDDLANALNWSRNSLITESALHLIRLIENLSHHPLPNFVIQARALKQFDRCKVSFSEEEMNVTKVIQRTSLLIHPILFKKVDHIAGSIKWSRNAFISESLIHTLNMVKDDKTNPIPIVVMMGRSVIPSVKFATAETDSLKVVE